MPPHSLFNDLCEGEGVMMAPNSIMRMRVEKEEVL